MMITAMTAPTRGPDYIMPAANGGTPIVTAPAAATPVAPEPSFATMPPLLDITPAVATKKKLTRFVDRAPPQRYLTASRGVIVSLLPDLPTGVMSAHLAAQAYQAQRRAESEEAATAAHMLPMTSAPPTHASLASESFYVKA